MSRVTVFVGSVGELLIKSNLLQLQVTCWKSNLLQFLMDQLTVYLCLDSHTIEIL